MALMSDILVAVSRSTNTPIKVLRGTGRRRPVAHARFLICHMCRTLSPAGKGSLTAIGRVLNCHHTSVLHGLRRFEELQEKYPVRWARRLAMAMVELSKVEVERRAGQGKPLVTGMDDTDIDTDSQEDLHTPTTNQEAVCCYPSSSKPPQ